ncbi:hypothetical protein BJF79_41325 [Actinomadura sp. CNU-125]|uniref:hypothetical protein n=1 Tax=Actinomadura sp. CNU-125 TaxID=1904961 RepID=UPI000966A8E4|nr:hypothetical protein [Actinomadura sp. CNU-125]OLT28818.1 hypothetical protein BJF79_41325 [Actinomadura sp. CNU-125]
MRFSAATAALPGPSDHAADCRAGPRAGERFLLCTGPLTADLMYLHTALSEGTVAQAAGRLVSPYSADAGRTAVACTVGDLP